MNDEKTYTKYNDGLYGYDNIYGTKQISFTLDDVLDKFSNEELVEAMGIEKVENIIRQKKIKRIVG